MPPAEPLDRLRDAVARWTTVPEPLWPEFAGLFQVRHLAAGEHAALGGGPLRDVFFVADGLLRLYYTDAKGCEWNKAFVPEGGFAGSLAAYAGAGSSPYSIQAIETSTILAAPWSGLAALYDRHPAFERLGRRFAEWLLVRKELRERAFLELDAAGRYEAFLQEAPELAARLPLYHVASYIGVTEVSLSRIRGRLARKQ